MLNLINIGNLGMLRVTLVTPFFILPTLLKKVSGLYVKKA